MAASYDPTHLEIALNAVRFLLQDTGPVYGARDWLIQNEEINALVPGGGPMAASSNYGAAAMLADQLAARFTGMVSISEGSASADLSQLAGQYRALAAYLRAQAVSGVAPSFGGSIDSDLSEPAFTRAMGDTGAYPW